MYIAAEYTKKSKPTGIDKRVAQRTHMQQAYHSMIDTYFRLCLCIVSLFSNRLSARYVPILMSGNEPG